VLNITAVFRKYSH